jgi:hypothetical protein
MFLLMAMIGLAFDVGRIYIVRNEAQVFTDAAAMAAAAKIDGTPAGLSNARSAVEHLPMRWNFGTEPFREVRVEFSATGELWEERPREAGAVRLVRVTAPANPVGITFLRVAGGPEALGVAARSTASAAPVRLVE